MVLVDLQYFNARLPQKLVLRHFHARQSIHPPHPMCHKLYGAIRAGLQQGLPPGSDFWHCCSLQLSQFIQGTIISTCIHYICVANLILKPRMTSRFTQSRASEVAKDTTWVSSIRTAPPFFQAMKRTQSCWFGSMQLHREPHSFGLVSRAVFLRFRKEGTSGLSWFALPCEQGEGDGLRVVRFLWRIPELHIGNHGVAHFSGPDSTASVPHHSAHIPLRHKAQDGAVEEEERKEAGKCLGGDKPVQIPRWQGLVDVYRHCYSQHEPSTTLYAAVARGY